MLDLCLSFTLTRISDDGAITVGVRQQRQQYASLSFKHSSNKVKIPLYYPKQRPKQNPDHLIPICPSAEPENKRSERQFHVYGLKTIY